MEKPAGLWWSWGGHRGRRFRVELLNFTWTGEATMTEDRLPLNELLQKAGDGDFLRAVAESVLQLLMEADVEGLIGAGRHERAAERMTWRNGHRDRALDTRLGTLNLKIRACQEFCVRGRVDHHAVTNLSSNMMANGTVRNFVCGAGLTITL